MDVLSYEGTNVTDIRRRTFLTGTAGATVFLAGCAIGEEEDDDGEEEADPEIADEIIGAEPATVLLTAEDLDSGWQLTDSDDNWVELLESGEEVTITITIDDFEDTAGAAETYLEREQGHLEAGRGLDEVEYGQSGYLLRQDDVLVKIVFRGGNFVVELQTIAFGDSGHEDLAGLANEFAMKTVEKIVEQQ